MMTIRRLSIGAGYKYLLKSIAVGDGPEGTDKSDLVRYYSETGTPPGVFLGAGLIGLDNGRGVVVGQSVTADLDPRNWTAFVRVWSCTTRR
jgi:hypothetical protein